MAQQNNNNNDDHKYKKIFIGGLAWKTTTEVLRSFCQEQYGEVLDANVVGETLPNGTFKSKGYGFVTFRDAESASRACQPPHPIIEGRQTNTNLAYMRAKNNPNHSNQTGLQHQAGPSHQYQNGSFNQMAWHQNQNGPFNQMTMHQYPQFYTINPQFPQVYWDSHYGAHHQMHGFTHYPCSSNMNWHQTNNVQPSGLSQQPRGPVLEEAPLTNQEAASTAYVVHNDNDNTEEVDTETNITSVTNGIKQDVKDHEGEISGEVNGIKQDDKDEEIKNVSGEDDGTKQVTSVTNPLCCGVKATIPMETVHEEKFENTPQKNGQLMEDHEEEGDDLTMSKRS